jgi:hypothetical protein
LDVGFEKLSRELRQYSVLGPATCRGPGKRPGPPPATVKKQTVIARVRPSQRERLPEAIRPKAADLHGGADQVRDLEVRTWSIPTVKLWSKDAAARRATRRLPLGEPPLVVTTHAITSFTTRFPRSRGSPASSESGLSSVALRETRPEPGPACGTDSTPSLYALRPEDQGASSSPDRFTPGSSPGSRAAWASISARTRRHSSATRARRSSSCEKRPMHAR